LHAERDQSHVGGAVQPSATSGRAGFGADHLGRTGRRRPGAGRLAGAHGDRSGAAGRRPAGAAHRVSTGPAEAVDLAPDVHVRAVVVARITSSGGFFPAIVRHAVDKLVCLSLWWDPPVEKTAVHDDLRLRATRRPPAGGTP